MFVYNAMFVNQHSKQLHSIDHIKVETTHVRMTHRLNVKESKLNTVLFMCTSVCSVFSQKKLTYKKALCTKEKSRRRRPLSYVPDKKRFTDL